MMRTSLLQRVLVLAAALFLLGYVGVQIYVYIGSSYKTETVYLDSIRESAKISGIVLRQEEVLQDRVNRGITAYTVEDGEKVSKGMAVAEVYQNAGDAQAVYHAREVAAKRERLEHAQEAVPESFSYTNVLNKQIFGEIGNIAGMTHSGNLTGIGEPSEKLLELMNTKQITTGIRADFAGPIQELRAKEAYYMGKIKTNPSQITASKPGYFIRNVDGLEGYLNPDNLGALMPADVSRMMMMSTRTDTTLVGKLMTSHNWYYAVIAPLDDTRFRKGRSVTLDFGTGDAVDAVITEVNKDRKENQAVVVFRSNYINPDVVTLRNTQAEVSFNSISGLRVSTEALRFQGLERGVYVVQGENMVFRQVNILYEGSGFVLCENVTDESRYEGSLKLYDEVITEGWQLYNGKPIK